LVDIKIIFDYIDELLDFSRQFCHELDGVVSNWEDRELSVEARTLDGSIGTLKNFSPSIGDVFLENVLHIFKSHN
jgi:hypothetical protein